MREKILFSWSSGKDSGMAFYVLSQMDNYEVTALLTTVTDAYQRVSMHGVRVELLEQQAESLGLPLEKILITPNADNKQYEEKMQATLEKHKLNGVSTVAFGDIFLEDLKKYREDNLAKVQMKACFPIWKRDTAELSRTFVKLGFKAVITCVDTDVLDGKFAGRIYDDILDELPANIDPCGENGEFHSFVFDGPIFAKPIAINIGQAVLRDNRFNFCDVLPAEN